jgi:hypothetical protein
VSTSVRILLRGIKGRHRQNFNMPGVIKSRQSVVHITAGQAVPGATSQVGGVHQEWRYLLGDANIWVSNISPHFGEFSGDLGGVEFIVNVDWPQPLDIGVTITVETNTPIEIGN